MNTIVRGQGVQVHKLTRFVEDVRRYMYEYSLLNTDRGACKNKKYRKERDE